MGPAVKPRVSWVPAGSYKLSKAKQLAKVFSKLQHLLLLEWPGIRSANLGVKSGTSILEDVLLLQLNQLATQLHTLAVSDQEAASLLVGLAGKLSEQDFQQLQVLLDVLGHEELSDYLALLVRQQGGGGSCSSKGYSASAATAAALLASCSGSGTMKASQLRGASSIGAKLLPGCEGGNLSGPSWQRRNRAAAGVAFDLEGLGSMRERGTQRRSGINSSSCPDLTGLRFACLLPPGHLLTKTAEQLQRQQEFEAALQASKAAAAAAAAAARAQQHAPTVLQLPGKRVPRCGDEARYRPGSGNSCSSYQRSPAGGPTSPFRWAADDHARPSLGFSLTGLKAGHSDMGGILAEPSSMPDPLSCSFKAPSRSVEQIWKDGRRATTEAVLDAAHLQLHEGPFGALLLEPSLVLQARAVQQQASSDLDATAAAAWARPNSARSRRGPATSRPCSPAAAGGSRRGTRFNTVGVVANAHVAEGAAQSGGPPAVLGSVIGASAAGCGNVIAVGDGTGLVGRHRFAAVAPESPFMRPSMWATSPAAAARCKGSIAMGDAGTSLLACSNSSSMPCLSGGAFNDGAHGANASPAGRVGIAGPRLAGVNLLDPEGSSKEAAAGAGSVSGAKAGVPALQLSRLGSMHAPSAAAGAAVTARPESAGSSSRSRPDSAISTSRLAVSAHANGQHLV